MAPQWVNLGIDRGSAWLGFGNIGFTVIALITCHLAHVANELHKVSLFQLHQEGEVFACILS